MKKVINFRPLFFAFLGLMTGLLGFTFLMMTSGLLAKVLGWSIVGLVAGLLVLFIGSLLVHRTAGFLGWLKAQKWVVGILLTSTIFGALLMGANWLYYNSIPELNSTYEITGNVSDLSYEKDTYCVLILTQATARDEDNEFSLFGKVKFFVYDTGLWGEDIKQDSQVTFMGTLQKIQFDNVGYALSQYANKTIYTAFMTDGDLTVTTTSSELGESIRVAYDEVLHDGLPSDMADLSFSLLFGGDDRLEEEVLNLFSVTGVVHIISVSGLHVAVLMLVLLGLLKLLKIPRKAHIWILGILLIFYAYLCGFVPSVVRSVIMGLTFLLASRVGQQYDPLSALSLSGLLILLIAPLQLFTLGFELSFVCIFAMISLSPPVTKGLVALHIPKGIAQTLSFTGCITLLTAPLIAYAFYQLPIYGVISNLIVVPLLSLAFVLLFVIATLSLFITPLTACLIFPHVLLHFSTLLLTFLAQLPAASVGVYSDGYVSLLLLFLLAFTIRFIGIKPKLKAIISMILVVLVVASGVWYNLPKTIFQNALWVNYQTQSNVALLTTSEGKQILIGQAWAQEDVLEMKHWLKISHLDAVVAYDFSLQKENDLKDLCQSYGVEKLFVLYENDGYNARLEENFDFLNLEIFNDTAQFAYENVSFRVMMESEVLGLQCTTGQTDILFLQPNLTAQQFVMLSMFDLPEFDWAVVANTTRSFSDLDIEVDQVICQKNWGSWSDVLVVGEEKLCQISL